MVTDKEFESVTGPRPDEASLTRAHVVLCRLERELRDAGRGEEADAIAYTDLVILVARNSLTRNRV